MKKTFLVSSIVVIAFSACSDSKERYISLSDGKAITIEKDEKTGAMINMETKEPVYIYVDTKNNDTIYGKTGKVINGHVVLGEDKKYIFDEDEKLKIDESGSVNYKDGDYKMEIEKDGDIKIKDGDKKIKIDGETGERKTKKD
jgi:pyruvate kinase